MQVQVYALDIKEYIDKDFAWLAPNNKYYTSQEAYHKLKRKQANAKYYRKRKRELLNMATGKRMAQKKLNRAESAAYKQCIQRMFDWMGYPSTAKMPKFFFGLLGQWHNINNYSYEVILETMSFCEDMVEYASTKSFESDSNKIRYICAIIRDHLNDGLKQFTRKQRALHEAQKETKVLSEADVNNVTSGQSYDDRQNLNNVMDDIMGDL